MALSVPNDFIGDESLGIISPGYIENNYFTVSSGGECLFSLNLSDDLDVGRESLGILKWEQIENGSLFSPIEMSVNFHEAFIEDQNISPINKSKLVLPVLNQGFLLSDNTRSKVSICDSNSLTIDDIRENDDSVFKDDVLEKIVNNSIVNDADENVFLDCTPQPDWPELLDLDDSNKGKKETSNPTETVFKTIEKMFPRSISIDRADHKISVSHSESKTNKPLNTQDKSVPNNTTSRLGNSQDISMPDSLTSQNAQAQNIINNLSVIFNSTNVSEQQKIEGKKLLNNLAAILSASTSMQLNVDSELSSIPENLTNHESNQKENSTIQKCLTHSLNLPNKVKEVQMKYSEACTSSFNNNKSKDMPTKGSFKIKAQSSKPPKRKAPLIALIPVDGMMKSTPDLFNEDKMKKGICSVKTSTPKNDLKMHPNATSTPENLPKIGNILQTKPLVDSFRYNKIKSYNNDSARSRMSNYSNTLKNRKMSLSKDISTSIADVTPIRRNSISDIEYERKRINSISKSTGIMAVLPKIRGNLLQKTNKLELNGNIKKNKPCIKNVLVKPLKNKENVQP